MLISEISDALKFMSIDTWDLKYSDFLPEPTDARVESVAISPDGVTIFAGLSDGKIICYEQQPSGNVVERCRWVACKALYDPVLQRVVSPGIISLKSLPLIRENPVILAVSGKDITIWSVNTRKQTAESHLDFPFGNLELPTPSPHYVHYETEIFRHRSVPGLLNSTGAITPNGSFFVFFVQRDMRFIRLDCSKKPITVITTNDPVQCCDFNPMESGYFVIGDTSGAVNLWDMRDKKQSEKEILLDHKRLINGVKFSPNGTYVGIRSGPNVLLYDRRRIEQPVYEKTIKGGDILSYQITWIGDKLVTGSRGGKVFVYDCCGQCHKRYVMPFKRPRGLFFKKKRLWMANHAVTSISVNGRRIVNGLSAGVTIYDV